MAACGTCGEKAGIGRDECASCRSTREQRESEVRAQREAEAKRKDREHAETKARELEERTAFFVFKCVEQMKKSHQLGLTPSLMQYRMMNTSYSVQGQTGGGAPNFSAFLADLSLGWEAIAVVPHTEGVALTNQTGNGNVIYAGGMGGIVTGVYVLMRLWVTPQLLEQNQPYVEAVLRMHYEDGISTIPSDGILNIDSNAKPGGMSSMSQMAVGAAAGMFIASSAINAANIADGGVDGGFDGGGGDFGGFDF